MKSKEEMLPTKTPMTDERARTISQEGSGLNTAWSKEHAWKCFARKLELALINSRRMCRDLQREVNRLGKARSRENLRVADIIKKLSE